jgi:glyoxylase-like metal-dependent hydrolase (beta-lactamase superfamily II)
MIVKTLAVGQLQTNCYLVMDEETGEAMVLDPGAESERVFASVQAPSRLGSVNAWVKYVVNTHAHFDHVLGNASLLQRLHAVQEMPSQLVAHTEAVPLLAQGGGAALFGFRPTPSPAPDKIVQEGDVLCLGQLEFRVLHTPGHSPGSISLYSASEAAIFVGDVLFRLGVGRYDLPGGSWAILQDTIRSQLFVLPDSTTVYPGHGPATTIGREKKSNPFLS